MSSTTIPLAFTKRFSDRVNMDYQRAGAILRGTMIEDPVPEANIIRWPKLIKTKAVKKARGADIPTANLEHQFVEATMEDSYAAQSIDKLDQLKTNVIWEGKYSMQLQSALGRDQDDTMITALEATTNQIAVGGTGLTKAKILEVKRQMDELDVPAIDRFWAIAPQQWENMAANVTEFSSIDFNVTKPFAQPAGQFKFLGFHFIQHTGLTLSTLDRTTLAWHHDACGLGMNKEIEVRIDYEPRKFGNFIAAAQSFGSKIIDDDGVWDVQCLEV